MVSGLLGRDRDVGVNNNCDAISLGGEQTEQTDKTDIIQTHHWTLPVDSLEGWRPFTAYLDHKLLEGPDLSSYGRGLSLHKDLMGGMHGARGSGKSILLSYLLAKKMRSGKPVWTNYPISFYVIEENGELTYYESMPLDFEKFYTFSPEVRKGAVGITELQYYVEARTSNREQNRIATYQIMQLRKAALSFLYDVQDRHWVDKRFGWSNDFDIECSDIAKMNYDRGSVAGFPNVALENGRLRDGAYIRLMLEDTSGVLTGTRYKKNHKEYGPYQFAGWNFWEIFPTYFIIDVYNAVHSLKKKDDKAVARDVLANALLSAITDFLKEPRYEVISTDLFEKADDYAGVKLSVGNYGRQLSEWGISSRQGAKGKRYYNIGVLLDEDEK